MKRTKGLTLIELVVVLAVVAMLAGMLLPSLEQMREMSKAVKCKQHQKEVAKAIAMYTADFDEQYPYGIDKRAVMLPNGGVDTWPKDVDWDAHIGRIPEDEIPYNWSDVQREIAMDGYITFHQMDRSPEGFFKCPEALDQIEDKAPNPPSEHSISGYPEWQDGAPACYWGSNFSMNGNLTRSFNERSLPPNIIAEDSGFSRLPTCTRTTDVERLAVLIADGKVRWGAGVFFQSRFSTNSDGLSRTLEDEGPWPFLTTLNPWSSGYEVDYYGHPGQKANICYTDGSVKARKLKQVSVDDWRIAADDPEPVE